MNTVPPRDMAPLSTTAQLVALANRQRLLQRQGEQRLQDRAYRDVLRRLTESGKLR
jgi:hypothetical protein